MTSDDIMRSVLCSGESGPDLGPGPRLPAEAEAEVSPGPGPGLALSLRAPDTQAEVSGHQANQARVGLDISRECLLSYSFIHSPQCSTIVACLSLSSEWPPDRC